MFPFAISRATEFLTRLQICQNVEEIWLLGKLEPPNSLEIFRGTTVFPSGRISRDTGPAGGSIDTAIA